jgi:hypothetical protein
MGFIAGMAVWALWESAWGWLAFWLLMALLTAVFDET